MPYYRDKSGVIHYIANGVHHPLADSETQEPQKAKNKKKK